MNAPASHVSHALREHHDHDRMQHFNVMTQAQQAQAIRNMAAAGIGDHAIASATRLSVEAVRRVIGDRS